MRSRQPPSENRINEDKTAETKKPGPALIRPRPQDAEKPGNTGKIAKRTALRFHQDRSAVMEKGKHDLSICCRRAQRRIGGEGGAAETWEDDAVRCGEAAFFRSLSCFYLPYFLSMIHLPTFQTMYPATIAPPTRAIPHRTHPPLTASSCSSESVSLFL